jgi:hypothetical protein
MQINFVMEEKAKNHIASVMKSRVQEVEFQEIKLFCQFSGDQKLKIHYN